MYKMQLDFSSYCPPSNVTTGSTTGISRIQCFIDSDGNNKTPILISSYRISELDGTLLPVRVKNVQNVSLFDGDNVTFMSDTNANPGFLSGGIQVSMTGVNTDSQTVTLDSLIQFTNRCNSPPFAYGDTVGWLRFVSLCFIDLY